MKGLPTKMMADVKEFQRILPCAQLRHAQVPGLAVLGNTAAPLAPQPIF
ncbi:hypothetical protein [Acidovorax carolinensis]|nr:hypothetical protein [Acidovorax carolinensis]